MARKRHIRDEELKQALLELSMEEVRGLEQQLQQDPALASQADDLYHRHRRQVVSSLRKKKAASGRPVWRYAALAASLVLVFLALMEIGRPRKDIVVLTQPTGGFTDELLTPPPVTVTPVPMVTASPSPTPSPSATPEPSPTPSPSATLEPSPTPSPSATQEPSPTALLTPEPTPTLLISPSPEPTPAPEPAPAQAQDSSPQWSGSYLPRLPEDYSFAEGSLDGEAAAADFRTENGKSLRFVEYFTASAIKTGTAGHFSYHRLQGGITALAWQTGAGITILWDQDGRSFSLSGQEPLEQLLIYAGSISPVQ